MSEISGYLVVQVSGQYWVFKLNGEFIAVTDTEETAQEVIRHETTH